ncbi:MAG: class I SAM-dependent methyltransferase [Thermoanaerobaculia bacterium]
MSTLPTVPTVPTVPNVPHVPPVAQRSPYEGALQILRFNWPWYGCAIAITAASLLALWLVEPGPWIARPLLAAVVLADFWLVGSLVVSHLVYDRSAIASGAWLDGLLPQQAVSLASFHAGLDEASGHIALRHPEARLRTFDFHDAAAMREPSIARARALQGGAGAALDSPAISFTHIPLEPGALDAAFVVFAAHELRVDADRLVFFSELRRVLRPGGDLIVVEHLRDAWNFLAFGPGAFHFLPRSTWMSAFGRAGFHVRDERRITPFVALFHLRASS